MTAQQTPQQQGQGTGGQHGQDSPTMAALRRKVQEANALSEASRQSRGGK